MRISGKNYPNKNLSPPKACRVVKLIDFQKENEIYERFLGKTIVVQHYHENFKWNFLVHYINPEKGNVRGNRVIWYGYNFTERAMNGFHRISEKRHKEEIKKKNKKYEKNISKKNPKKLQK